MPDIHSKDYTSVIDERAFQRLVHSLADAEAKGASLINLNQQEPDAATRKFPLTLVLNSNDDDGN